MDKIRFTVTLDSKGFTIEGLEQYSAYELGLIAQHLPDAVKAVKHERKKYAIEKKLKKLERKPVWTFREALWYSRYSNDKHAYEKACDRFNMFKELDVSGI